MNTDSVSNKLGTFSLTLSAEYGGFCLLFVQEYDELGAFCHLLSYLLGLNSSSEIARELEVGDGHVIQDNVELSGSLLKSLSDFHGDLFSLRN